MSLQDDDGPTPARTKERGRVRQLFNYALAFILIFVQDKLFPFIVNFDDFVIKLLNLLSFFLSIISYVTHNPIYIYILNRSENRSSFRSNVFRSATAIRRSLSKSYHIPEGIAYRVPVPVPRTASIRDPGNLGLRSS